MQLIFSACLKKQFGLAECGSQRFQRNIRSVSLSVLVFRHKARFIKISKNEHKECHRTASAYQTSASDEIQNETSKKYSPDVTSLCRLDCPEFQPNAQLMVCLMECKDRKTYVSDCPNQSISTIHTSLPAFADGKFGSATVTRKLALHPPGMSNKPVALSTSDYALCIQLSIVAIWDVETRRTRLRF
ncbi:hypothetical protein CLF_107022 [Clonorchis sinensis]|uniref:Uncharacterized protein n=1 Tax=Clonorchis sinensis TaxID=79923 RepID=G7YQB5_CLOSI|nr:hypothetical protein CLF_107022 [Clonorchis sinensis]